MSVVNISVLVGYLLLMVLVAAWFSRKSAMKDGEDFMLAGQSLPPWVLAGTLLATFVGSGSIIGGASFIFANGPIPGVFFFLGTFVGIIALSLMAKKVRENSFHTVPELLRARFGQATGVIGTIVVLVAFIGIAAYQFTGAGYIFSLITPLSEVQGTLIAVVVITFLSLSGGLKSVAWTDFLSSALIVIGLLATLYFVFVHDLGGFGGYVNQLDPAFRTVTGKLTPLQILGYFLPLFLLVLGDQNMHQRLAAAQSPASARKATGLFFIGAIFMVAPIILLASAATIVNPSSEADMAILGLAAGDFTPAVVGATLLVAALALIVTTGSSYLLTCSGNIVYDLVFRGRRREPSHERSQVVVGRIAVAAVAVLAFVMVQFFPTLLELQMYAYTMYGAAVTPTVLAALFWKRASAAGAVASMLIGGIATILWEVFGPAEEVRSVVIAAPIAIVVLIVVSLATKPAAMVDRPARV
ncbi:sodium:solute symporter family protein [Brevibacterium gallinarum]|uniref:Sodium:solute symporter family protein n=2 Tax=Brevibacterium TaxID=1696 RepID=A0ABR8WWD6_9MICO|nr:sodium:solute symporter family protein [Brevibacterium gallinarum]MBD8021400.1 sodium:solute symporter family protein [Brevibacterium gallinarum]NUL59597.1 sodium:solute symporter family protein [Brevibacterium luteolum]